MINISMNTKPPTSLGGKKVTPQPEVIEEVVEEEPQLTGANSTGAQCASVLL